MRRWATAWVAILALLGGNALFAAPQTVSIGVLTHRGEEATLAAWNPTADYLSNHVHGYRFVIKPLDFDDVDNAVTAGAIDFILVNSGMYVNLEVRRGVSRIATLNNRRSDDRSYNVFGGVIFTRADRTDIKTLQDLHGSRFAAVHPISLGGYQMAWREMHALGIEPRDDFKVLDFLNVHDRVVQGVLNGTYDAGTVRTDILERMVLDGKIEADQFRIVNPQPLTDEFPFVRSTRLYPEWPFAKARATSNELAQQVAVALLSMPRNHRAALAGRYAGWTVPLDYQLVHDLFKELNLGPYASLGKITLGVVWRKYWYWVIAALLIVAGAVTGTAWIVYLYRELARAKAGLERRYESILRSVGEGVYGVDLNGLSTFVNPAMERLTGWSAAELIGQKQHDLLHHTKADGSAHPREECPVYLTIRDGKQRQVEDVFWRRDGTPFPVEFTSAPVRDSKGSIVGAVVVFRDITERREAEAAERDRQAELAHAARLSTMGEMATGIAHEVNQPLSAIANYTAACIRMLQSEEYSRDSVLEAMQLAARQARRAGEIIRRIRAYIRKAGPAPQPVDINSLIREVVAMLKPDSLKHGIVIELDLAPDLPPVPAHAIEIEQVTLNLARNAIDAMASLNRGPLILRIATRTGNDGQVEVRVSDRGVGFNGEDSETVFTPFYTTKSAGMGLGLSISRRIVESHGGTLWATANADQGATFHFSLPTQRQEAA